MIQFLAQRERQEFERILREQQRDIEKEKAERLEKGAELGQHAALLRRQIQERERQRIEERKQFFAESENLTSEQEEHEKKIQKVRNFSVQNWDYFVPYFSSHIHFTFRSLIKNLMSFEKLVSKKNTFLKWSENCTNLKDSPTKISGHFWSISISISLPHCNIRILYSIFLIINIIFCILVSKNIIFSGWDHFFSVVENDDNPTVLSDGESLRRRPSP